MRRGVAQLVGVVVLVFRVFSAQFSSLLFSVSATFGQVVNDVKSISKRGKNETCAARLLNDDMPVGNSFRPKDITTMTMDQRRWTVVAIALALIAAPVLRVYCASACNAAADSVMAQAEHASFSAPCHRQSESPAGNLASSIPATPGQGRCCGQTQVVTGSLPWSAGLAHNLEVSTTMPVAAAISGMGTGRPVLVAATTAGDPLLYRSLRALRL